MYSSIRYLVLAQSRRLLSALHILCSCIVMANHGGPVQYITRIDRRWLGEGPFRVVCGLRACYVHQHYVCVSGAGSFGDLTRPTGDIDSCVALLTYFVGCSGGRGLARVGHWEPASPIHLQRGPRCSHGE